MKKQTQQLEQENGSPSKGAYRKPSLKEFGSVGMLTQAGTAGAAETGIGMNPNQMV